MSIPMSNSGPYPIDLDPKSVTLAQDIYVKSRILQVQRIYAGQYNLANRERLYAALVASGVTIDNRIDILGQDAAVVMADRTMYGYSSYPAEGDGDPFNAGIDASGNPLPPACSIPGNPFPGSPSYEDYIAEHGPFRIKVSVNADDYPASTDQYVVSCVGKEYTDFFTFKQLLSDLTATHITNGVVIPGDPAMQPLNEDRKILLPDQTDAADVPVNDDGIPELPLYTPRPNDQQRFGLLLRLDGGAVRAYWYDDVKDAYHSGGIDGVKSLAY